MKVVVYKIEEEEDFLGLYRWRIYRKVFNGLGVMISAGPTAIAFEGRDPLEAFRKYVEGCSSYATVTLGGEEDE